MFSKRIRDILWARDNVGNSSMWPYGDRVNITWPYGDPPEEEDYPLGKAERMEQFQKMLENIQRITKDEGMIEDDEPPVEKCCCYSSKVTPSETGDILEIAVPGLRAGDIEIFVDDSGYLNVTSEKLTSFGKNLKKKFFLEKKDDPENIKAECKDGLLKITIGVREATKKNIPISAG